MDELEALKVIDSAFSALDEAAQARTFQWLAAKYSVNIAAPTSAAAATAAPVAPKSMTPKAVATALNAQSGPDLLYAAAAYLAVIQGLETFSRQALLDTMKSATGFYKPTFNNNLSSYLDGMGKKGVLIEVSPQTYAVKSTTLVQMQQKLAVAA
jgi:hypothetical protein